MTSKTNKARANRGRKLLKYHQRNLLEEVPDKNQSDYTVGSLLTDLRHLCDQDGLDFFNALSISLENYIDEVQGCDDYLDNPDADT